MAESEWIPIEEIDLTGKSYTVMSCDTRDFKMVCHEDTDTGFVKDLVLKVPFRDKQSYIIRKDDIIPWLTGIKDAVKSINYGFTQCFVLKFNVPDNVRHFRGWIKYIRFARMDDDRYFIYTTCSDDKFPLSQSIINKDNIHKPGTVSEGYHPTKRKMTH